MDRAPPLLGDLARRMVDAGEPAPADLDAGQLCALAWTLKDACYAAWSSDPAGASAAAEALAGLATATSDRVDAATRLEIDALAQWTAAIADLTRGRMADAAAGLDRAAALFTRLGRPGVAAQTQVPKIMALAMLGEHAAAAACAERTQRELIAAGDLRAASKVSLNSGSLQFRRGAYAEAARHYRDAAVLFSRSGDREHSVMADVGLADALTALGELDEADRIYARARLRAGAHGLPVLQALVDESAALLDLARGRYGAALAGLESSRRRYDALAMPQHLAIAEKQLADAYLELRLWPEALALYEQALARLDALDMPHDAAWTLAQRGRVLALLGRGEAATGSFERAAALFDAQGSSVGAATVALCRAELALAAPPPGEAARTTATPATPPAPPAPPAPATLTPAPYRAVPTTRPAHTTAAAAALELATTAAAAYAAAGQADGRARADVVAAHALLRLGRIEAARASFEATLASAREARMLSLQVRCLCGLGLAAQAAGEHHAAEPAFEAAVTLFEAQREALPGDDLRTAFLADHLLPYRALLRLALQAHAASPTAEAAATVLRRHERFRARALEERLAQRGGPGTDADEADRADEAGTASAAGGGDGDDNAEAATADLRARYNWLARRAEGLGDADEASPVLQGELRRTEQELLERSRRARLVATSSPAPQHRAFDPEALCRALGDGDALVDYGLLGDELVAAVYTPGGVVLLRHVAHGPDVLAAVRSVRFQIEALSHGASPVAQHMAQLGARVEARLRQLHALIWAPLAARLGSARRVLIVATGPLGTVPFAALHGEAPAGGSPAGRQPDDDAFDGGQPLGLCHQLAVAPSARVALRGLRRAPVAAEAALVLAESSRLPHAAVEARAVATVFGRAQLFVDAGATLAALRDHAAGADVVHLACHGQFRRDSPSFSALHLHDAALTAEVAETLALKRCTVVLSGCETALADGSDGDEAIGLVRAFLVAGAARVVASLWPVDDQVTARFMQCFHGELCRGGTPAVSLQRAQAAVRRHHAHPFYWAAFVLHGGW